MSSNIYSLSAIRALTAYYMRRKEAPLQVEKSSPKQKESDER